MNSGPESISVFSKNTFIKNLSQKLFAFSQELSAKMPFNSPHRVWTILESAQPCSLILVEYIPVPNQSPKIKAEEWSLQKYSDTQDQWVQNTLGELFNTNKRKSKKPLPPPITFEKNTNAFSVFLLNLKEKGYHEHCFLRPQEEEKCELDFLDKLGFLSYLLKNDCRLSEPDIEMRDSLFPETLQFSKKAKEKRRSEEDKKIVWNPLHHNMYVHDLRNLEVHVEKYGLLKTYNPEVSEDKERDSFPFDTQRHGCC